MSVPNQIGRMRDLYPNLPLLSWYCGLARWEGRLRPLDAAHDYLVNISYRLKRPPAVHVFEPSLVRNKNGEPVPHRYSDGGLCLYYPKYGEWRAHMSIAETIVPWTCLWLYHYEVWLATGEWLGGGIHHEIKKGA